VGRLEDKALAFAAEKHKDQTDEQGRPYFFAHVVQVHGILKEITDDEEVLCAGLLHDILEDTDTTYDDLIHEFNKEIADLVYEVTQVGDKEPAYFFPNIHSRRAFLVMFADRLSNLSRMVEWPGDWQLEYLKNSVFWKTKPWKKDGKKIVEKKK
jgi:GTP pyrophosphokinase